MEIIKKRIKKNLIDFLIVTFVTILGILIFEISTSKYGIGTTPDSADYLRASSDILNFQGYNSPYWPPLYPFIISIISFGQLDLLFAAKLLNFLLIILVVNFTSYWFKMKIKSHSLLFIGLFFILFSSGFYIIIIFAWSDLLFILLILLSLYELDKYLLNNSKRNFYLSSIFIALSSLTRYIGVVLIITELFLISIRKNFKIKEKLKLGTQFIIISGLPIGSFLIRNYLLFNTLTGIRGNSNISFLNNIFTTFDSILKWFIDYNNLLEPILRVIYNLKEIGSIITIYPLNFLLITLIIFIILIIGIFTLIIFSICIFVLIKQFYFYYLEHKNDIVHEYIIKFLNRFKQFKSELLFIVLYLIFINLYASLYGIDPIGDRLLSPILIPLIFILLFLLDYIIQGLKIRISTLILSFKLLNLRIKKLISTIPFYFLYLILLLACIACPFSLTRYKINYYSENGGGFSNRQYNQSEILYYLKHNELEGKVYSNNPWVVFLYANLKTDISPRKYYPYSTTPTDDLIDFTNNLKANKNTYIIWFKESNSFLHSIEELRNYYNVKCIVSTSDGYIFKISVI